MSARIAPKRPETILARLDRISVWSLPYLFIGVIGVGFLFTFYDIFNINVSFIETCGAIVPHCTPVSATNYLGLPVLLNLVGYVVGSLSLSPLADRFGRRDMLLVTMLITGLGSLWTATTHSYAMFTLARAITGIGIGADLAIVNTYINEVAPREGRARYTALIFIMSALGAFLGIWLGLLLTTPATPFPLGLPFAVAGPHFADGWRDMYYLGALLALVGVVFRVQMPESPRWLISRGRIDEADAIVRTMEERAERHGPLGPIGPEPTLVKNEAPIPYKAIFADPLYRNRTVFLLAMWLLGYVTVYGYGNGFTTFLVSMHYAPPEAGLIAAFGTIGFILSAVMAFLWGEKMERKYWLIASVAVLLVGSVLIAEAGNHLGLSIVGAMLIFFGFNLWVPIAYAWSTEHYPTRARATGFALVDGIGHIGGGLGVMFLLPVVTRLPVLPAFLIISGFLLVGAIIAQFGLHTRGASLDHISP